MTGRALGALGAAVFAVLVLCSGVVGAFFGEGGANLAGCGTAISGAPSGAVPPAATPSGTPQAPGWSSEQIGNATVIVATGQQKNVPPRGWVIAVATAMQESTLINTPEGDRDSVGLFQQRPSQGWGDPTQPRDPAYAAGKFYDALLKIDGWQQLPLTDAAQKVQKSAYPDAYAKWEDDATTVVAAITGMPPTGLAGCSAISAQGWTQPVHAPVGSGFRTASRPNHQGVDLIVGKGTPIHAAASGVVSVVRCNISPPAYGCDRDGSTKTPGCGWYVDITHPGNVITRYCHQLRRPDVVVGQQVTAGDVIGVSGSSGHSSGPHLHFEVHLGDHTSATATDPVTFMASVGALLGTSER
jgi:murein DD-endopeptidase MepM/ murein hydrolase activator NlpD